MDNSSSEPRRPAGPWRAELAAAWRSLTSPQRWGLRVLAMAALIAWGSQLAEMPWRSALRGTDNTFYYFWLRSAMVHGDWDFRRDVVECNTLPEDFRASLLASPPTETGRMPNKYGVGWALLSTPFYLVADGVVGAGRAVGLWKLERDGYNPVYQIAIHSGQLMLALLSLWLAWRCARRWCDPPTALLGVATLWGASPLIYSQTIKLTLAHNAAFFTIALLTWAMLRAREEPARIWPWWLAGAALGLAIIVRFQLVMFAVIPIWFWCREAHAGKSTRRAASTAAALAVGAAPLLMLQMYAWRVVYGHWIINTYGENGEGFNWTNPAWEGSLLSARHGLFYWHPFLLAGLAGLGLLVWRRNAMAMAGALAVALTIYVNAAWWCWWFGSSFGQRAFDGAVLFLMLGFAFLLSRLPSRATRLLLWLGAAAAAWNFYLMAIFYTTAIPRNVPVTWLQMLQAGAKCWHVIARFLASGQ